MIPLKELPKHFSGRGPLIHLVLDGWGIGARDESDAIHKAHLPNMNLLLKSCPGTQLLAHGKHVGLPNEKDLGGSEVGHMTMGAGMIKEQGPTLIQNLIDNGDFFQNDVLDELIQNCIQNDTPLHLLGLLSDGNIHSHYGHTIAIVEHAFKAGVKRCYVHALLDGRDVGVQSALDYTEPLEKLFAELKSQRPEIDYAFASGGGREFMTMDRDNNWAKVEKGWKTHVLGKSENQFTSIKCAIEFVRNETPGIIDQDMPDFVIIREQKPVASIEDNHSLIFTNFRGDRAIEFTRAVTEPDFNEFDKKGHRKILFAGMSPYDQDNGIPEKYLVGTPVVDDPFGKRILEMGLKQFRLTETQKFAHITFFYNGGYKEPLDAKMENYHLIASDKIDSFADRPEMKAFEISEKAVDFINSAEYQYGLINFANADMVGHTGNFAAAIQAVENVDQALGKIVQAVEKNNGLMVITADHGNADQMLIKNKKGNMEISTKHSLNPVPFLIYDPLYQGDYLLKDFDEKQPNNLSHIAATNFILLGQDAPDDLAASLFKD